VFANYSTRPPPQANAGTPAFTDSRLREKAAGRLEGLPIGDIEVVPSPEALTRKASHLQRLAQPRNPETSSLPTPLTPFLFFFTLVTGPRKSLSLKLTPISLPLSNPSRYTGGNPGSRSGCSGRREGRTGRTWRIDRALS